MLLLAVGPTSVVGEISSAVVAVRCTRQPRSSVDYFGGRDDGVSVRGYTRLVKMYILK